MGIIENIKQDLEEEISKAKDEEVRAKLSVLRQGNPAKNAKFL